MKELSIEDKAKRYDEALQRTRRWYDANTNEGYRGIFEDIFPELKESDDERIRKELLNAFQESEDSLYMVLTPDRRKSFIAWLEKKDNLMGALQEANKKIGELVEENYYLKEERKGKIILSPEAYERVLKLGERHGEQKSVIEMITPEESLGIDSDTYNKIVDECVYGKQKPYSQRDECLDCQLNYSGECKGSCVMKKGEQKPAWSKDDETKIKSIIALLKSPALCTMDGNKGIIDESIKYLKSLKYRVQLFPRQL